MNYAIIVHVICTLTRVIQGQQAWVLNATLRDNVLFGCPYEEKRYLLDLSCPPSSAFHVPSRNRIENRVPSLKFLHKSSTSTCHSYTHSPLQRRAHTHNFNLSHTHTHTHIHTHSQVQRRAGRVCAATRPRSAAWRRSRGDWGEGRYAVWRAKG